MATTHAEAIHIGIDEKSRRQVAEGLSRLLADTYTLYLLTQNFHWNVTGPTFHTLHLMFEAQYQELALAVDGVAERIRALGFPAPATYDEFAKRTAIVAPTGVPPAEKMIRTLVESHEAVIRTTREIFPEAEKAVDEVTVDLLIERLEAHEKTAWMLRSLLQ